MSMINVKGKDVTIHTKINMIIYVLLILLDIRILKEPIILFLIGLGTVILSSF
jgi:hypothetical protein